MMVLCWHTRAARFWGTAAPRRKPKRVDTYEKGGELKDEKGKEKKKKKKGEIKCLATQPLWEISLQSFKADVYFMCHGLVLTEMMMYISKIASG